MNPLDKRKVIRETVAGRSFIDIGGLWGTKGEMVTTAARGGAARAVMADIQEPGSPWWQRFRERCAELGVADVEERQVDICAPHAQASLGRFDFVHCSGVMYHVPDLFQFVGNLMGVTGEYLLLSSVVMPERIGDADGGLVFGPDSAYLAPLLTERNRTIVADYLRANGFEAAGLTRPAPFLVDGAAQTGPWWWLFSGSFMSRLIRMYGFEIVAEGPTPTGFGYTALARRPGDAATR